MDYSDKELCVIVMELDQRDADIIIIIMSSSSSSSRVRRVRRQVVVMRDVVIL